MRLILPVCLLLLVGCASVEQTQPLEYGCSDLVVVGRLRTLSSTSTNDPSDILGHSMWDSEIDIDRVIRGKERRRTVRASGFSHAQVRDDVDLVIVLATTADGGRYSVRTLNVWPTSLASRCTSE